MDLSPGVRARTVDTDRLQLHLYEAGLLEGSGHGPFLDAQDRFAALLFGLLEGC